MAAVPIGTPARPPVAAQTQYLDLPHGQGSDRGQSHTWRPNAHTAPVNMTISNLLTAEFKNQPYWWDRAPPLPVVPGEARATTDVAIVGSGLTALSAALTLLRGGREVVV